MSSAENFRICCWLYDAFSTISPEKSTVHKSFIEKKNISNRGNISNYFPFLFINILVPVYIKHKIYFFIIKILFRLKKHDD